MGKHFSNKHFSNNKHLGKKRRRNGREFETAEIIEFQHSKFEAERALPPIKPLNQTQAAYLDALRTSPQVVVLGPAGTGKTWIAATHAADLFRNGQIDKIIAGPCRSGPTCRADIIARLHTGYFSTELAANGRH